MRELRGKVAVVTGAGSGIGLALCEAFVAAGASVVMADIDRVRLDAASARLDGDVLAVAADVSRQEDVHALAERARERFGGVDVLCNNAGVTFSARVWKIAPDDMRWLLGINFFGVLHGVRAFVPHMLQRGTPAHIVNTASVSGLLGFPGIGAYAASKFAVVGLSESLLHDLRARGVPIGVSVLCPGSTATGLAENSRLLHGDGDPAPPMEGVPPDAIADAVLLGIREDRFWILTHPGYTELLERRHRAALGADEELVAPGFFL